MQQFIPFNDQWDDRAALVPYQADPTAPRAPVAPARDAAVAQCGSRFNEEDLFAGWP
jgi:hypothetical protein